jgi:cytochrome P450
MAVSVSCPRPLRLARLANSHLTTGPILSFRVYNGLTVVLNTHTAVTDLLERRAAIYSGRPVSWMFGVICGRANAVFNISAIHPRHRIYRRLLQRGLNKDAVKQYFPILEKEVDVMISCFRDAPAEWGKHLRRNAAAVIMKVNGAGCFTFRDQLNPRRSHSDTRFRAQRIISSRS